MNCSGFLLTLLSCYCLAPNSYAKHTTCAGLGITCSNVGQCINLPDEPFYHCDCPKGYFGNNCENTVCDIQPCIRGQCQNVQPSPYFSCTCEKGFTGDLCQDAITTPSITTTIATPSTGFSECDKFGLLGDIVERTQISHNMTTCMSGGHVSPEAFVIEHCNVTSSFHSWKKGLQVMEACNGRASLPAYTPVAVFKMGHYIDNLQGGTTGVFLGCLGDSGFKIGMQSCDSVPLIEHINGTFFTMNPNVYFAIV